MDNQNYSIDIYSAQSQQVLDVINRDGRCFSRKQYVQDKYQESAPIFVSVYDFFVTEAEQYVAKPEGAEYPYWGFKDLYRVDGSGGEILKLSVPIDEVVFFDLFDFNKMLCLKYIGENEADEQKFRQMLTDYGVRNEADLFLTQFYPDFKRQVLESWKRLFRHHEKMKSGDLQCINSIQVGLWQIKKEWIR